MATVHLQANHAAFTDGVRELEVDGATVGAVIDVLAARFDGLGPLLRDGSSVAVNGELQPKGSIYTPVGATDEVHFLAPISGG